MAVGSGSRVNWERERRSFSHYFRKTEADMDSDSQRQPPKKSDEELALLYQLGLALASGKDLFTTLVTLQTEILKLIRVEAMFIAIYHEETDMIEYPIYFEVGK